MEFFLSNSKYTLPYRIYGHGSHYLIAFHGFGRTGTDFQVFEKNLGHHFTIFAFDLPYHGLGKVNFADKTPAFTKEDLKALINQFCHEKKIIRFSVLGYSLGGKIALACLEVCPGQIEFMYLLAPDGLKVNPFYFLGTRTWVGQFIFRSIINHPGILFKSGNFLEKMKWMNPRINHFVKHHMDTVKKRKQVFNVWILFRKFIPDLNKIIRHVNENGTGVLMIFGRWDSVIPARLAAKLMPGLRQKEVLHILACGHRVMDKHEEIAGMILKSEQLKNHKYDK